MSGVNPAAPRVRAENSWAADQPALWRFAHVASWVSMNNVHPASVYFLATVECQFPLGLHSCQKVCDQVCCEALDTVNRIGVHFGKNIVGRVNDVEDLRHGARHKVTIRSSVH